MNLAWDFGAVGDSFPPLKGCSAPPYILGALSQLRIWRPPPPPLKGGHLDIKDTQCAENKNGRTISYHIISRLGAACVQKERFGRPEIQHFSKLAKLAWYIGIDLALIYRIN